MARRLPVAFLAVPLLALHPRASAQEAAPEAKSDKPRPLAETLTGPALDAYKLGKVLLDARDGVTAHGKFREAYDRSREPRLLWNMAVASKEARRYSQAIDEIDRFLAEGQQKFPELAAQATSARAVMESLVAPVRINVVPADAAVFIDGEAVKLTADAALRLDIGKHELRAERSGYQPYQRALNVQDSRGLEVSFALEAIPAPVVVPVPAAVPAPSQVPEPPKVVEAPKPAPQPEAPKSEEPPVGFNVGIEGGIWSRTFDRDTLNSTFRIQTTEEKSYPTTSPRVALSMEYDFGQHMGIPELFLTSFGGVVFASHEGSFTIQTSGSVTTSSKTLNVLLFQQDVGLMKRVSFDWFFVEGGAMFASTFDDGFGAVEHGFSARGGLGAHLSRHWKLRVSGGYRSVGKEESTIASGGLLFGF
jgi:hypothetical protein